MDVAFIAIPIILKVPHVTRNTSIPTEFDLLMPILVRWLILK